MARGESALSRLSLAAKVIIVSVVMLAGAAVYFALFHTEVNSRIQAAGNKETKLLDELKTARKNEFAYQKDLQELTERQQRQRELNKVLPQTTEYPSFLSALQSVANVSGISLTAWSPEPEVPEQFYARVPMKIEISGRYHQLAKFFYQVGQLDRIINIENISVTEPKKDGDDFFIKVVALATAFKAAENATAGEPGKPGGRPKKGSP
ncbi:MAG: type 4a pilus biogenesis protein PilO [Polyangiaceae bacterium]|nr:type 4a pilus biogenesis protein PilO [Myxococcales bacterium]MCB9589779.1 type 4a pilus biogenesis protein PilO [Polyangiaceae bacterium]